MQGNDFLTRPGARRDGYRLRHAPYVNSFPANRRGNSEFRRRCRGKGFYESRKFLQAKRLGRTGVFRIATESSHAQDRQPYPDLSLAVWARYWSWHDVIHHIRVWLEDLLSGTDNPGAAFGFLRV